jgi:hypothetical protein
MNFDDAISAHIGWKIKFRTAVNTCRSIDAPTIGQDDTCPLGQWLKGEAKRLYGTQPVYRECVEAHSRFHREAGRVAQLINSGDFAKAGRELESGAPFGEASTMAVVAINKFKRVV